MNYFGIIDREEFENKLSKYDIPYHSLSEIEIEEENKITFLIHENEIKFLLADVGVFDIDYITDKMIDYESKTLDPEENINFEDLEVTISANKYLTEKVFSTISFLYKKNVLDIKLSFFDKFRNEIYGLNFEERKKIALSEFKRIYSSFINSSVQNSFELYHNQKLNVITSSHFYNLYFFRQRIINSINNHCYLPYLYGDLDLYLESPYNNQKLFNEIALFQINLEILTELNNEYHFETDIYFNNIFYYQISSIPHEDLFKDFNAYSFIMYHLNKLSEITSTYVESMYAFLIIQELYKGKKTEFAQLINNEFKTNFEKIRDYETNEEHNIRVENIKIDWENFVKKYY